MARNSQANLFDKDIRALEPKDKMYRKAVGNPKELYIVVYPSGVKTFSLKVNEKYTKIENFRQGIYSVAEARKDAMQILKEMQSGIDITQQHTFNFFFEKFISQQYSKGLKKSYIDKVEQSIKRFILPRFGNMDMKNIKYIDLLETINAIFNPNNPQTSRLETIHRLINTLNRIFDIALISQSISSNPIANLHKEFPTKYSFNKKHELDTRLPALTQDEQIAEFLHDLKMNNNMDLQTKRALFLQILCFNRPINTASAKWEHIDLQNALWEIPAKEMKMGASHIIPLNSYILSLLRVQRFFSENCEYVFPAFNSQGHIHRDSLSKAIRTLNGGKYANSATTHGFRATFRTICSKNEAELLKLGISNNVIETALAHKTHNQIQYAYEREKSTIEQLRILMQWYGDYLNSLCPLDL